MNRGEELFAKASILVARGVSEVLLFGLVLGDKFASWRDQADQCCRREGECPCDPKVGLSE